MAMEKPAWLCEARDFCKRAGIEIVAWGPELLTVEAKSPERAKEIAAQLGELGFKVIQNEDNDYAGILDLSRNPSAVQAAIASFDISHRRLNEQVVPIMWAFLLLVLGLALNAGQISSREAVPAGLLLVVLFVSAGIPVWGWRLEMVPEGFRVRRNFRWGTIIPWEQIRAVETVKAKWRRGQESVVLKLRSHSSEILGTFDFSFARNVRDRLRYELAQRER